MLIEVTEKEARWIYSERYIKNHTKKFWVRAAILLILAFGGSLAANVYINELVSLIILLALVMPVLFMTFRLQKNSGKYAKSKLEEG